MSQLSGLLQRDRLGREITIALLLKLVAIGIIWWLFFSEPVDHALTDHAVAGALLGAGPVTMGDDLATHTTTPMPPMKPPEGETP